MRVSCTSFVTAVWYLFLSVCHRIDRFLENAPTCGFFLDASQFRESALLSYNIGHHSRPSAAVLYCVYLWGIFLSNDHQIKLYEKIMASTALEETSRTLSGTHPKKALHAIQAEILLAQYFFMSGRLLEGRYHLTSAVSLGMSGGIYNFTSPVGTALPAQADVADRKERVRAAWTLLILDKSWALITESPPNISADTDAMEFNVPWPQDDMVCFLFVVLLAFLLTAGISAR
jgi:hypothetical protein